MASMQPFDEEKVNDEALARQLDGENITDDRSLLGMQLDGDKTNDDEALARQLQLEYDISSRGNQGGGGGGGGGGDIELGDMGCMNDIDIAMALQQAEMVHSETMDRDEGELRFEDPVWGALVVRDGERMDPVQVCCFAVCPCCAGEVCVRREDRGNSNKITRTLCPFEFSPSKYLIFGKILGTVSMWLAILQIFMLMICLTLSNGLAPANINPMFGPYPTILNTLGAKNAALIVYWHEWWRLVTPMFLHTGFIHLFINISIQIRVGVQLEIEWGSIPFCLIYFISGVTSSQLSCIALPDALSVGSSGALMGLLGAWMVEILCNWGNLKEEEIPQQRSYLVVVGVNIFITLMFSFVPFVDWSAHLGGLIGGSLVAAAIFSTKMKDNKYQPFVKWFGVVGTVLFLGVSTYHIALNLRPDKDLLHICKLFRHTYDDPTMPC